MGFGLEKSVSAIGICGIEFWDADWDAWMGKLGCNLGCEDEEIGMQIGMHAYKNWDANWDAWIQKLGCKLGCKRQRSKGLAFFSAILAPNGKCTTKYIWYAGRALPLLALIMGLFSSTNAEACIDVTVEAFSVPFPWRPRQGCVKGTRLAFESHCLERQHAMLKQKNLMAKFRKLGLQLGCLS